MGDASKYKPAKPFTCIANSQRELARNAQFNYEPCLPRDVEVRGAIGDKFPKHIIPRPMLQPVAITNSARTTPHGRDENGG